MKVVNRYYQDKDQFHVAVDCIIFGFKDNELCLLIVKRGFEPCKGKWSLAGGFLKKSESLWESVQRVLEELTGLTDLFMEQVGTFGDMNRDPGERVVSTAYYALINLEDYNQHLVKKYHTHWVNINRLPQLIFDHGQMIKAALEKLQQKVAIQPIGFNLLPEKFTLTQLQRLYEVIFQRKFDNRNFRKKFLSLSFIEKLFEKDKTSSKRGAFYYTFNKEKYEKAVTSSLSFAIGQLK